MRKNRYVTDSLCPTPETNATLQLTIAAVKSLSSDGLLVTPWTAARRAPLPVGTLQARLLEWVAVPSSRGSSRPRDRTPAACIAGGFFTESPAVALNPGTGSLSDTEKPRGDGGGDGREAATSPGTDAWSPQKPDEAGRTLPWSVCRELSPGTP